MRLDKSSDGHLTNLFLDMLAAEQGAGDNTLQAYRSDLEDLSEFIAHRKKTFLVADTQILRDYLADLDTRGFKSTSVARKLSSMRHLFRFLLNERARGDDVRRRQAWRAFSYNMATHLVWETGRALKHGRFQAAARNLWTALRLHPLATLRRAVTPSNTRFVKRALARLMS